MWTFKRVRGGGSGARLLGGAGFTLLLLLAFASIGSAGSLATIPTDPSGARGSATLCLSGTAWVPCSVAAPLPITGSPSITGSVGIGQKATLLNSDTTGPANTAVTTTLPAAAGTNAHIYSISARCSAGSAGLTVTDGGTTIYSTPAGVVSTTQVMITFPIPLTGSTNTALAVTLSTCGVGNTGTLIVQADRY